MMQSTRILAVAAFACTTSALAQTPSLPRNDRQMLERHVKK